MCAMFISDLIGQTLKRIICNMSIYFITFIHENMPSKFKYLNNENTLKDKLLIRIVQALSVNLLTTDKKSILLY